MGIIDFIYDNINKRQQNQNMQQMGINPMMQQPMGYNMMQQPIEFDPMMQSSLDFDPMLQQPVDGMSMMPLDMQVPLQQDIANVPVQHQQMAFQNFSGYAHDFYGWDKKHFSKSEILEALKYYITNQTNIYPTKIVKLDDYPQLVPHACVNGKVQKLIPNTFTLSEIGVQITYWFCMYCGKLFILKDAF